MLTWWLWMVLGLVLAAIELATPGGFFIVFFGVGALIVGVLELIGLVERDWLQWLLFPLLSLAALRLFRRPLLARLQVRDVGHQVDSLVGEIAIALTDMPPHQRGRAELRGTTWSAHNVDPAPIVAGQRCRVVTVDGLSLDVRLE